MEERAETVLDVKLGRHAVPRPSDGEVCNLMCNLFYWRISSPNSSYSFTFFVVPTFWASIPRLLIRRASNLPLLTITLRKTRHRHSHHTKLPIILYDGDTHPVILQIFSPIRGCYNGRMDHSRFNLLQIPENNLN